ncbi:RsmB/NOP family class I SAM-dependent RNA methyltransferase [Phreatobacter stygius]|uniref:Methyltransferase domain-containing protein n=1 Tax=Phreatobacter stygius TaxID=1940610 RepID=A0A4D7AZ78_9HYPH|nr:RsmB/NOP family class I SAM-dependent RNA methyltransferase [Phreatobacter stygius]QCI64675.1 methyltransferase domain-containing protein [Phreatobacter stygius]
MSKRPFRPAARKPAPPPGLASRRRACELVETVTLWLRPLDEALDEPTGLDAADRALARKIAATALRRLGSIDKILRGRLAKGLPDGLPRLKTVLQTGACQILFLDVPDYAAVDVAVRLVEADRKAKGFVGLTNAVLRGIARDKELILAELDALDDLAPWLRQRWTATYGEAATRAIAEIQSIEPPLDLTVKADPEAWAARLAGRVTPTGSVRLSGAGPVTELAGFDDGAWWVQDAAAALPARLLGDVRGLAVADLCAAPGGKTAQLAAAGAVVTAVDRSAKRLERLTQNMQRLGLTVTVLTADAMNLTGSYDAVLLDAPCTATGTVRGHPDVMHLKTMADVEGLARMQARLLDRVADLLKPGGKAIYCTCSLEPEEGEQQISALIARDPRIGLDPIDPDEFPGLGPFIGAAGMLRTLPSAWANADASLAGLDGFFAARLVRH